MTNPSGTADIKLRHSCDACAVSKVKCQKQKPTCSRCQRRGVACHYLAIKRSGRRYSNPRADSAQFSPTAVSGLHLDFSDMNTWLGTGTSTSSISSNGDDTFLRQLLSTNMTSVVTPFIPSSVNSNQSNDDFFMGHTMSTVSTPCTTSNSLVLESAALSPINLSMDLDDYIPSTSNLWTPKIPEISPIGGTLPPFDLNQNQEAQPRRSDTTTALETCMTRATQIMQQQFRQNVISKASESSCQLSEQEGGTQTPKASLKTVIDANKQTIDAVSTMLQCPCLQDGYLLTIISLIVFKILDSYSAAAAISEVEEPDADATEDDVLYMAAQRILGELHRVQRLVKQLSINIKRHTATESQLDIPETVISCGQERRSEIALPFSTVMLSQLEEDMRKRLKSLSTGMAAHLRRD
jgi:hypothetical protein